MENFRLSGPTEDHETRFRCLMIRDATREAGAILKIDLNLSAIAGIAEDSQRLNDLANDLRTLDRLFI
jgi:signal transduction histidine kinase